MIIYRNGLYYVQKSVFGPAGHLAYTPSCVSLEYALGFYGLIPERVVEVTSITTKKTLRITNPVGRFSYQHVTTSAFRGFKITKDENGMDVFIAEPEAHPPLAEMRLWRRRISCVNLH